MGIKKNIKRVDNYIWLVIVHIVMGAALFFNERLSTPIFLILMVYFIQRIIIVRQDEKTRAVLLGCAYFVGIEVLFRITKAGISYEASKYLVVLFMLMGMFFKGISGKGYPYFIYLVALVPAILVASVTLTFDAHFRTNVTFVLSGPICLGIAALFCYDRKVSRKTIMDVILYLLLPTIALTVYLFFYTPSIKDVLSSVASNRATSGGFGPNQVATSLGLGMFAIAVRLFLQSPNLFLKLFNLAIFAAIAFRAVVTFSRGGVVAAIIVISAFLWTIYYRSTTQQKNQIIGSFMLLIFAGAAAWVVSSNQTSGLIDNRYTNKDSQGREKQDFSTGRLNLLIYEIEGFLSSPFLGVGASRTKNKRFDEKGAVIASHNEIGRLLSEHGMLGFLIIAILIIKPLTYRSNNKSNYFFYAFLAFWFATINHSGMRIAAPSFLYALSLINVVHENYPLHRKQLKK